MNRAAIYLFLAGTFLSATTRGQQSLNHVSYSSLQKITSTVDFFYFVLNDDEHGLELWRSNGTTAGTHLIKDINPGKSSSVPDDFQLKNGVLYFTANDGIHGKELWRSNGTTEGTFMVKDIFAGVASSSITSLTTWNDVIVFQADNGIDGAEIWKSDGTTEGTVLIKDVFTGEESSYADQFTPFEGKLYFRAVTLQHGDELWRTDGTAEGTFLVKDIGNGSIGSSPIHIVASNDNLFFAASTKTTRYLYKSKGTSSGTFLMKRASAPASLIDVNGLLFFTAYVEGQGRELWRSNGNPHGTNLVKDIASGAASSIDLHNSTLCEVNGIIHFLATDEKSGRELWRSDGMSSGTFLVKDINPGVHESFIRELTSLNGMLYFSAYDGQHGNELWKSDGSSVGTMMIKDILPGIDSSLPGNFAAFQDRIFFSVVGTDGIELWMTDGTESGTKEIFPAHREQHELTERSRRHPFAGDVLLSSSFGDKIEIMNNITHKETTLINPYDLSEKEILNVTPTNVVDLAFPGTHVFQPRQESKFIRVAKTN